MQPQLINWALLKIFEFIKAVSDTVLDMINVVYLDKPLIFIGATFREKLVSRQRAVNEADSSYEACRLETVALTKESHFIGRLRTEGGKLPKTTDHWSLSS